MMPRVEVEREASVGDWVAVELEKSFVIAWERRSLNPCAEEGVEPGLARIVHLTFRTSRAGYLVDYVCCV